MFYIAYKSDGTTACKKQISLSRLTEVGKTKSGVTLYCTPSTENDGAPYRWFYTVEGIPDLLDRANISPYAEPEQIRTILDGMSESQAAQVFPDAAAKLEQIKLAIVNKGWTSNADALFCEICGDFATANAVRLNRAEYRARQNEEEEKKAAAEQERIAKQNAEEKLAEKQRPQSRQIHLPRHVRETRGEVRHSPARKVFGLAAAMVRRHLHYPSRRRTATRRRMGESIQYRILLYQRS